MAAASKQMMWSLSATPPVEQPHEQAAPPRRLLRLLCRHGRRAGRHQLGLSPRGLLRRPRVLLLHQRLLLRTFSLLLLLLRLACRLLLPRVRQRVRLWRRCSRLWLLLRLLRRGQDSLGRQPLGPAGWVGTQCKGLWRRSHVQHGLKARPEVLLRGWLARRVGARMCGACREQSSMCRPCGGHRSCRQGCVRGRARSTAVMALAAAKAGALHRRGWRFSPRLACSASASAASPGMPSAAAPAPGPAASSGCACGAGCWCQGMRYRTRSGMLAWHMGQVAARAWLQGGGPSGIARSRAM